MSHHAVLIVGAGPVGLSMAAHLHLQGVACRLIDRNPQASTHSKALVLWPRTLEMLDAWGVADEFVAAGMFLGSAHIHGGRRLLAHIELELRDTRFPQPLMLAQSETERLLAEHLQRAGVTVERGVELTTFADHGEYVEAALRHGDGREEVVRCGWLIGCDGAHSTVRKGSGAEFRGSAEPNDWILADCRVDGPVPQDTLSMFWHVRGALAFFPFAPGRCRIIADQGTARGEAHPPEPTLADMQRVVDERGPARVRLSEPHWLSGFRIQERKVADYRRGRIFLAGDAAHIHSPAGGQGMNTGMQDTWNLAWKLALVEAGTAPPALLDSYSAERSRVGELVLKNAARLTWLATLRNPVSQLVRNTAVSLLARFSSFRRRFARGLSELDIHYPDSPLNGESNGRRWATKCVRPGDRLPDTRLHVPATGTDEWLLRLLRGPRYHVLLVPADGEPLALHALLDIHEQIRAAYLGLIESHFILAAATLPTDAAGRQFIWLDPSAVVRNLLGARATALVLVRPDGYVAYRAQPALWDGLQAYLARWLVAARLPA